jgi:5'-3' exoribonuclease 2
MLTECSVNFEVPKSIHIHKSMLLRGVKVPPPTLDELDIQVVKSKAQHSGRSFGGAPLRNGTGNGKGGRINYATDRPNPFAVHLDPAFTPPSNIPGVPMPPPGWLPPGSAGFPRGPPPPRGGFSNSYHSRYSSESRQFPPPHNHQNEYYTQRRHYGYPQASYQGYASSSHHNQQNNLERQLPGASYHERQENRNEYGRSSNQPSQRRDHHTPRRNGRYGHY